MFVSLITYYSYWLGHLLKEEGKKVCGLYTKNAEIIFAFLQTRFDQGEWHPILNLHQNKG